MEKIAGLVVLVASLGGCAGIWPPWQPPAPGEELKHSGRVRKGPSAVTVDVVTADLSKDKRREE